MDNEKPKKPCWLWFIYLLVAVVVGGSILILTKSLPLIGLPIVVVGIIVILAWLFH